MHCGRRAWQYIVSRRGRAWNLSVSLVQTVLCKPPPPSVSLPCRPSSAFSACLGHPSSQTVASSSLPLHTLGRACASHSLERKQPEKRRLPRLGAPPSERQAFLLSLPAAPSCHMLSRAPIQSRPVPFQLAVGRESRGEAPAPVRPPFPSSLGGHRLWSSTGASLRWIKMCGAEPVTQDEGPPKSKFVSSVYQVGPGRQLTMEAARMPRGSAGWFPSFAASIKTADLVACQRPTASMASAKDLCGLPAQPHSGCRMVCST